MLIKRAGSFRKNKFSLDLGEMLGNGLVTAEGQTWEQHRRFIQPVFYRESVRQMIARTSARLPEELAYWEKRAEAVEGQSVPLVKVTHDLMIGLSVYNLFSVTDRGVRALVAQAVAEFMDYSGGGFVGGPLHRWLHRSRMHAVFARLDAFIFGLIAERRAGADLGDDFLGALLRIQAREGASVFSDRDVRDEAFTMLAASHETMANTLAWCLYELASRPEWQDEIAAAPAGEVAPLATAVFLEGLRCYPPAWMVGREAAKAVEVSGEKLQAGDMVLIPIWHIHRHPRYWQEPERFWPERFAGGAEAATKSQQFLPFGLGARGCLGRSLADWQGPLVLAGLVQRFRFSVGAARQGSRRAEGTFQLLMRPPEDLGAVVYRR